MSIKTMFSIRSASFPTVEPSAVGDVDIAAPPMDRGNAFSAEPFSDQRVDEIHFHRHLRLPVHATAACRTHSFIYCMNELTADASTPYFFGGEQVL